MPVIVRKPMGRDTDDEHHTMLIGRQCKNNNDASPVFAPISIGPTVVFNEKMADHGPMG